MASKWAKIVAWIALFCIFISVIWTGILFIIWSSTTTTQEDIQLTPEDLEKLIWTGTTEQTQTWVELSLPNNEDITINE
jgi:hypothetical protein